ncbi:DUF3050 domain-containing protein [Neolewinella aurantiaca]|uniref:DUF3050 domain-containing protein n=1 Tax=Neolewinella aurantiaca TaxID=2602767 RepID=A0A5C7FUD2_9BACT|nr:DUF3050 domain-containing protein [Neolewinella aurantiaca]TXF90162.1 DUF3050 domain-containing protein [Neolewinella aurantiaca]
MESPQNIHLDRIEASTASLREQLRQHPLYEELNGIEDLRVFSTYHVFAVWDFMSLLKSLQSCLTTTTLPWRPAANPALARFINEIVWGEESDVNEKGEPTSHFEMYLEAMREVGAPTEKIEHFLSELKGVADIDRAAWASGVYPAVRDFLNFTFGLIREGKDHKIAAAFTFGREDLIPDLFLAILGKTKGRESSPKYPKFLYYIERHIEVDGDEHGPLSLMMVEELCGQDEQKWAEAEKVAKDALKARIALWNGIASAIREAQVAEPATAE